MYKLLVVTNDPEVITAFDAVKDWGLYGFKQPHIVSSAHAAMERLKQHHADGIAYELPADEAQVLDEYLMAQRPRLPIMIPGRNMGDVVSSAQRLAKLLDKIRADFSDDSFTEEDLLQLQRHHYFRKILLGRCQDKQDMLWMLKLLRSRMDPNKPCVLAQLKLPEGDNFLKGRWHYGADRLEVALRNFFGAEYMGMRVLVSVLPDERIFLLTCPMIGRDTELGEDESITNAVTQHANESIEIVRQYLNIDMTLASVRVLRSLTDLSEGV